MALALQAWQNVTEKQREVRATPSMNTKLEIVDRVRQLTRDPASQSTSIRWKEGNDLYKTGKERTPGKGKKRSLEQKSFFNWFTDHADPSADDIAESVGGIKNVEFTSGMLHAARRASSKRRETIEEMKKKESEEANRSKTTLETVNYFGEVFFYLPQQAEEEASALQTEIDLEKK
uniref:Uncharacterized protein n=1 Tax=Timema cristinae TaxID=61476 RepID=A0A7R9H4X6_TIMCR|nr:unnamed protein product [Timema cristinae]